MNNSKILSFAKDTVYYLTAFFPLAFSMAVCFGFPEITGVMFSLIAILFAPKTNNKKTMPVYLAFMLMGYAATAFNLGVAFGASIVCGILLMLSPLFASKLKKLFYSPAVSGVMLATALTATVLFTTDYFGIGANGDTVTEMIKSYVSLGFHPNWRGVLYGTVVMVIMITFPRKFKKLTKTVSAPFIAMAVTLVLNLILNPPYMKSAINEITDGTMHQLLLSVSHISKAPLFIPFDIRNIIAAVLIGTALFFTCFYAIAANKNADKKDYLIGGAANIISGGIFSMPLPYGINRDKKSILPRITAAAIMLLLCFFGEEFILRIPLHSCAVVIIVGAWQNMEWSKLKKVFSGVLPVLIFAATVITCLVMGMENGIILSVLLSAAYVIFRRSKDF